MKIFNPKIPRYFPFIILSEASKYCHVLIWVRVMVLNATFNNISVISWRSALLVEKAGENHWQTLSHMIISSTPRLGGIHTHNFSCDRYWMHRYVFVRIWFVVWKFQWFHEQEGFYWRTLIKMIKSLYFDNSLLIIIYLKHMWQSTILFQKQIHRSTII